MSVACAKISERFRRGSAPSPVQSPVADLPYDKAVEATASMVEKWKMEQPSLPGLEVLRSAPDALRCADDLDRWISQNQISNPGITAALVVSQFTHCFVACGRAHETAFAQIDMVCPPDFI